MFWDDLVRRWRKEAKVNDPAFLRAMGGHVAVLPAPRRVRQSRPLLLALAILALLALLLFRYGPTGVVTVTDSTEPTQPAIVVSSA
jgi:hypothetical protein